MSAISSHVIVEPPDIAIFIHSLGGGGAERVAVTLCNALAENNKRVHLVILDRKGVYWNMLSPKVEIFDLNRPRMRNALFPLMRYLRTHRPATLLCFLSMANVTGIIANLLALKPSRVIVNERAVYSSYENTHKGPFKLLYRLLPLLYHFANHMICVSQGVANDLQPLVSLPPHKVSVIYNPTIRDELHTLKTAPVEHSWFNSDHPVILSAGRLESEKNYSLLIEAFAEVRKTHKAKLVILGDGPEREQLQRLIDNLGITQDVDMPGFQNNPYAYMAKATAFIMCSDSEGLPNALIEALACGCPVVATDCPGGMREIIADQRYGLLVPKGNPAQLAKAINTILKDPIHARAQVSAFHNEQLYRFTPETVIPQYKEVLGL